MHESTEFADGLFDALARKRCITSPSITKAELHEFWEQITDTSFDARLQTFFDMFVSFISFTRTLLTDCVLCYSGINNEVLDFNCCLPI